LHRFREDAPASLRLMTISYRPVKVWQEEVWRQLPNTGAQSKRNSPAVLRAQREALLRMRSEGKLSNEVMNRILRELDLEESRLEI
jgi:hypothetical protein